MFWKSDYAACSSDSPTLPPHKTISVQLLSVRTHLIPHDSLPLLSLPFKFLPRHMRDVGCRGVIPSYNKIQIHRLCKPIKPTEGLRLSLEPWFTFTLLFGPAALTSYLSGVVRGLLSECVNGHRPVLGSSRKGLWLPSSNAQFCIETTRSFQTYLPSSSCNLSNKLDFH